MSPADPFKRVSVATSVDPNPLEQSDWVHIACLYVVERTILPVPAGRWCYRKPLYHVAVKAGFYRKAVEVYLYIPRPRDIHPLEFEIRP